MPPLPTKGICDGVAALLAQNDWSLTDLLVKIASGSPADDFPISINVDNLLNSLSASQQYGGLVKAWVSQKTEEIYRAEVRNLLKPQNNIQVSANNFKVADLERVTRQKTATIYSTHAPLLWCLVYTLLDSNKEQRRRTFVPSEVLTITKASVPPMSLDGLEGDSREDKVAVDATQKRYHVLMEVVHDLGCLSTCRDTEI